MLSETEYKIAKDLAENFNAKLYTKEDAIAYLMDMGWSRRFIIEVTTNMESE